MSNTTRDDACAQKGGIRLSKAVFMVVLCCMVPFLAMIEVATTVLMLSWRNNLWQIGVYSEVGNWVIGVGVLLSCRWAVGHLPNRYRLLVPLCRGNIARMTAAL